MNKYASGYTLIQVLSVIGWIIIVVSTIGGIFIASNADRGMGWVGISVAVAGSFQGLLLLGMGAIGTAILDGSLASQNNIENNKQSKTPSAESILGIELYDEIKSSLEIFRFVVASSLGKSGFLFVEASYGNFIFRSIDGRYVVNDKEFDSLEEARGNLRQKFFNDSNIVKNGEDIIYNGYKIAYSRLGYLVNGTRYGEACDVIRYLDCEISLGGDRIEGYRIIT